MKNLKPITLSLFLLIGLQSFAQSIVDGIYSSTFGNVSMTTEFDKEFPNGSIIYGDYRENGTMSGFYADFQKEIKGTFFNGSSEGKYIFLLPFTMSANKPIDAMNGFWGYTSDNKNSANANDKWNITAKTGTSINIKNATNVWSGTWNTTDGKMHLVQVGKNVTGRYKGLGTITAVYNPSSRLLKGTFLNLNNSKSGNFEFYFEGNSFKGKWGWTAAMTGGNWNGDKHVKNNKELSKKASSSNSVPPVATNLSAKDKYRIGIKFISVDLPVAAATQIFNIYGFAGVRVYRVTGSSRQEIKSFGNKKVYFFERTEDQAFSDGGNVINFSEKPENYREFEISKSDLDNPNVDIEVELWHHIKGRTPGLNADYTKVRDVQMLETFSAKKNVTISAVTRLIDADVHFYIRKIN